jgi:hypothetical protein
MTNQPYLAGSKRVSELDQTWIDEESRNSPNILAVIAQQCYYDGSAWFPEQADDLFFQASCAMAEAGEAVNQIKKFVRGTHTYEEVRPKIAEEAVDTFIYLMHVFALLDIDPLGAYRAKRRVNELRFGPAAGRGGSGLRDEVSPENGDGS